MTQLVPAPPHDPTEHEVRSGAGSEADVDAEVQVDVDVDVVVARHPVVDLDGQVVGYELVHCTSPAAARGLPGPQAPVTVSAVLGELTFGVDELVGVLIAFCRVGRGVLDGSTPINVPPGRAVLEVSAELLLHPAMRDGCRRLREQGHQIALSGVEPLLSTVGSDALLSLADLVKCDLRERSHEALVEVVARCARSGRRLWAAGCDTDAEVAWARDAGFDLVQGTAVHRPTLVSGRRVAPSARAQLRLSTTLLSRDMSIDQVEHVLRGEPSLVVQVLQLAAHGSIGGLRRTVHSLREALVLLGTVRLQQWAAVVVMSRHRSGPSDALATGLTRARTCELLAAGRGLDPATAFTAGLLSNIDQLLGVPADEVRQQVDIDQDLAAAAFDHDGPLGRLVADVVAHRDAVEAGGQRPPGLSDIDLEAAMAFCWAMSYVRAIQDAEVSVRP